MDHPPPSYNDVYPSAPSAPPVEHNNNNNFNQQGWPQQNFQYPQMTQQQQQYQYPQSVVQQPLLQPQFVISQHQQQPPVQQVIVVNQQMRFGENPVSMICPACRQQNLSKITYENNFVNHILAAGCCMLGLWCGCCLIPYCITGIKNVRHECSKCGAYLGLYRYGNRSG